MRSALKLFWGYKKELFLGNSQKYEPCMKEKTNNVFQKSNH
jgi:hypothetical protein